MSYQHLRYSQWERVQERVRQLRDCQCQMSIVLSRPIINPRAMTVENPTALKSAETARRVLILVCEAEIQEFYEETKYGVDPFNRRALLRVLHEVEKLWHLIGLVDRKIEDTAQWLRSLIANGYWSGGPEES